MSITKLNFQQKAAWTNIGHMLGLGRNAVIASILFYVLAVALQWLPNYEEFWRRFIDNNALSFSDKLSDIAGGFFNLFKEIGDLTPITFILIALFQSLSITMYLHLKKQNKKTKKRLGSLVAGIVGSGCVACGGSILSPVLGLIATNLSISAAQAIGDIALIFATMFSYITLMKVALTYAK